MKITLKTQIGGQIIITRHSNGNIIQDTHSKTAKNNHHQKHRAATLHHITYISHDHKRLGQNLHYAIGRFTPSCSQPQRLGGGAVCVSSVIYTSYKKEPPANTALQTSLTSCFASRASSTVSITQVSRASDKLRRIMFRQGTLGWLVSKCLVYIQSL